MNLIVEGIRDHCEEVKILIANRRMKTEIVEVEGIEVIKVFDFGRLFSAPIAPTFPLWLKKYPFDIIHFHFPNPTAEFSSLLAHTNAKKVVHYHSDVVRQKRSLKIYSPFLHKFLETSDRIIATSPNYLASSLFLRRHLDKCVVIPFGIKLENYRCTDLVKKHAEQIRNRYGDRIILFTGKLRYYKGITYLLEAMRDIDARLLVVGDGPLMNDLLKIRQNLPHKDRIVFIGQVENIVPYYHAADVFCLPSIYRSEAFGVVQLEAGACGVPIVSTRIRSGVPFVNKHNVTGFTVAPENPKALSTAINRLLSDDELRRKFGRQARERVEKEFTNDIMNAKILELYKDVLSDGVKRN